MKIVCNAMVFCADVKQSKSGDLTIVGPRCIEVVGELPTDLHGILFVQFTDVPSETAIRIEFLGPNTREPLGATIHSVIQGENTCLSAGIEFLFPVDTSGWYTAVLSAMEKGAWKKVASARILICEPGTEVANVRIERIRQVSPHGPRPTGDS